MDYRIEATHPAVLHSVREHGHHSVNGLKFELRDGRAISEPASDAQIKTFMGVSGYLLVRAEAPYDHVSDLSGEKIVVREAKQPEPATDPEPAPEASAESAAEPAETVVAEAAPAEEPAPSKAAPKPKGGRSKKSRSSSSSK